MRYLTEAQEKEYKEREANIRASIVTALQTALSRIEASFQLEKMGTWESLWSAENVSVSITVPREGFAPNAKRTMATMPCVIVHQRYPDKNVRTYLGKNGLDYDKIAQCIIDTARRNKERDAANVQKRASVSAVKEATGDTMQCGVWISDSSPGHVSLNFGRTLSKDSMRQIIDALPDDADLQLVIASAVPEQHAIAAIKAYQKSITQETEK
jgi:hypothetical protein